MTVISSQTRVILALSMLKGVGPAALKKASALNRIGELPIDEVARAVPQIGKALGADDSAWSKANDDAEQQVEAAYKNIFRILSPLDSDYPQLLWATKDDPFLLFVKGTLAKDPQKSVAIIGTREPTPSGEVVAQRITQVFVEEGWSIVSGLAIGCDAIAHRTALEHGGHTVAVLAHGLQTIAPSRHRGLAEEILEAGGALVSEYRFGQPVQNQQYVKRDRTQAGLAQGVVMIQSDVKGGSLHASRAALDYNRWLAVPYPTPKDRLNEEAKVQGNLLIADGADSARAELLRCTSVALDRVMVLRDRNDILRLAGAAPLASQEPASASSSLASEDTSGGLPLDERMTSTAVVEDAPTLFTADASDSRPLVGEVDDISAAASTAEKSAFDRFKHYCISLHHASDDRLRITNVPTWKLTHFKHRSPEPNFDVDLVVVFAKRLEYLQTKLHDVQRLQTPSSSADDATWSLNLQFAVEDVLVHMKRSLDDLARLDHFRPKRPSAHHAGSRASRVSMVQAKDGQRLNVDLVLVVHHLAESSASSVTVLTQTKHLGEATPRDGEVDVALDDLVASFNELVTQTIDERLAVQ